MNLRNVRTGGLVSKQDYRYSSYKIAKGMSILGVKYEEKQNNVL